jgi:hypothetical protein
MNAPNIVSLFVCVLWHIWYSVKKYFTFNLFFIYFLRRRLDFRVRLRRLDFRVRLRRFVFLPPPFGSRFCFFAAGDGLSSFFRLTPPGGGTSAQVPLALPASLYGSSSSSGCSSTKDSKSTGII